VLGYNVYRGTTSGGPYARIGAAPVASLTYTDTAVASGQTYYYVCTAVDGGNNESAYSNEGAATVP
jgi:fibronectin type 3 domain-containing protein